MSFFSFLDLFKTPVVLTFQKKEKTSTVFGIFLSIGLIIFLAINFFESDVFYKLSPRVENLDIIQDNRPFVYYNDAILTVSIEDDFANAYIDPRIFQIKITNYYMSIEGGQNYRYLNNKTKVVHTCTAEDFPNDLYSSQGFDNNFCLDDTSFETEGYWNENFFTYFTIETLMCNNETYEGICKSFEEIQDFFRGKFFNVYYTSTSIDTSNLKTPISSLISNEFSQIDLTMRKSLNIYLKNLQITTDDAYIFNNNGLVNDIIFDFKEVDQYIISEITDNAALFTCNFYSSRKTQRIKRLYQKLDEAFANLGGMANIVMIFGFLFTSFEKSLDLKKKIMNSLYSFQNYKQIKQKKSAKIFNSFGEKEIEIENLHSNLGLKQEDLDYDDSNKVKRTLTENNKINDNGENNEINEEVLQNNEEITNNSPNSPIIRNFMVTKIIKAFTTQKNVKEPKNLTNKDENASIVPKIQSETTIRKIMKMNSSFFNSLKKIRIKSSQNLEKMRNAEKFEEFKNNSSQNSKLKFNFFELIQMKLKQAFSKDLSNKEKLFIKGVEYHDNELEIVSIFRKLQEIEKLKIVLFNKEQTTLFNLIDKPLIYLENDEDNRKGFQRTITANQRMTQMLQSGHENSQGNLKKIFEHFDSLEKKSQLTEIDKRLMSLVDENLTKFANNFS